MTRQFLIERILRDVYNGQPRDDRKISDNQVNSLINDGIAVSAKNHYIENLKIDGVEYLNNSFYTTFKGLAITQDSGYTGYWKCSLPQVPFGLGRSEGIKSVKILSETSLSYPVFILGTDEWEYAEQLPSPNGILAKNEGDTLYFKLLNGAGILFYQTTATVTMASGGDSTNLSSTLNVPDEWMPSIQSYVVQTLVFERAQPKDISNDGEDNK